MLGLACQCLGIFGEMPKPVQAVPSPPSWPCLLPFAFRGGIAGAERGEAASRASWSTPRPGPCIPRLAGAARADAGFPRSGSDRRPRFHAYRKMGGLAVRISSLASRPVVDRRAGMGKPRNGKLVQGCHDRVQFGVQGVRWTCLGRGPGRESPASRFCHPSQIAGDPPGAGGLE
jgi:hypothetical protein